MSAESEMRKSRAQLLMDHPFFGVLALKLNLVQDDQNCDTAATDGKRLLYNAAFITKLTSLTRKGLIAHEVMHCVFNHMTRRQGRDPKIWNAAADFAINIHLKDEGFYLPDGGLIDEQYRGMSAEAIYNKIKDDPPKQCPWGMVLDAGAGQLNTGSNATLESEWQVAVIQSAEQAKAAGKLPGSLKHFIQDIIKPIVDWRTVLWPFCTSLSNNDYSWRKPNRAYISEDEYLPSMYNEVAGHLVFVQDTSASCDDYADQFWSEVAAVHSDMQPEKITIIHCDAKIQHTEEIMPDDVFPTAKTYGGGGTRFKPAFDWINDNAEDVAAVVYLTDLECDDFGEEPTYPVLWVSTTQRAAPWGQITQIAL